MKKLMSILAVAAISITANAATAKWSASEIYQPGSSSAYAEGYIVYFVDAASYSLANAKTDLGNKDTDFISTHAYAATGTVTDEGDATKSGYGNYANGASVTGYLVILDSASDPSYAYVTETATALTGGTGTAANLKFGALTGTQTLGNWYELGSDVPEPTSGLLLVLGGAMLALRRRRA